MKYLIFLIITSFVIPANAENSDSLSIESCYKKAIENFPIIKQKDLLNKSTELRIKNLKTAYLPIITLNAQATYLSDVTAVILPIPTLKLPELYKDQYKATLDINQTIWDGGISSKQQHIENISLQADQQNIEVQLYSLKDRINQIFFNIVLLQESKNLLQLTITDIKSKLTKIEASIKNGIMTEINADLLNAQIINLESQLIEINSGISSGLNMLGEFINIPISEQTKLQIPKFIIVINNNEINRPEYKLFELQQSKLEAMKGINGTRNLPKIFAFGQAGYGRPGLNMLSNEFDSFWMLGIKFSWNIWNWNQNKNDNQIYDLQKNIISIQKETLEKNIKISSAKNIEEIKKFEALINKDKEAILLREKILINISSQLENGVITSTEYLTELNAKTQAEINLKTHLIQLEKAKINYLNEMGLL